MQRDRSVHFLLDTFLKGDGMASVVGKGGAHGKSITAGELRWIYRNRGKPRVRDNVKFWTTAGAARPPWEEPAYADLWEGYVPASAAADAPSRPLAASFEGLI
jgi:hypothetical protein